MLIRHPTVRGCALFIALVATFTAATASAGIPQEFIAGADISDCDYFEGAGARYLDQGHREDLFTILKAHHINCIRLRLFTSSDHQAHDNPYEYINNLQYTLPIAVRAKKAGLRWMLDFHYSDFWADSSYQVKPHAWMGLSFPQLEQRMYEYNRDCLAAFRGVDAIPDYVQVGNEITSGMLWPDGATDTLEHWEELGRLIKAAIRGIRDGSGDRMMPKIIIHISDGDKWSVVQHYFDHVRDQNIDFDIIGLSYYPDSSSQSSDLQATLIKTTARFHRPVIIVETAFPWVETVGRKDSSKTILGISPGPDGQVKYIRKVWQILRSLPDGSGAGVVWWGAEYEPVGHIDLGGYDNSSLFDHTGNLLPAMEAPGRFGSLDDPYPQTSAIK